MNTSFTEGEVLYDFLAKHITPQELQLVRFTIEGYYISNSEKPTLASTDSLDESAISEAISEAFGTTVDGVVFFSASAQEEKLFPQPEWMGPKTYKRAPDRFFFLAETVNTSLWEKFHQNWTGYLDWYCDQEETTLLKELKAKLEQSFFQSGWWKRNSAIQMWDEVLNNVLDLIYYYLASVVVRLDEGAKLRGLIYRCTSSIPLGTREDDSVWIVLSA